MRHVRAMPNHIHYIIVINNNVGAGLKPAPTNKQHGLPEIVRAFKTFSSKSINAIRNPPAPLSGSENGR